jgi:hypothetical protein
MAVLVGRKKGPLYTIPPFSPAGERGSLDNFDPGRTLMNMNRLWIALPVLGFFGSIALAGYFWNRGPVYGEIAGRVTRGGVPLEHVQVVFYPEEDGPRSVAWTDKDGSFEAMTDAIQKVPARKGAPVGKYRVGLVDMHDRILAAEEMARAMSANAAGRDPKHRGAAALLLKKENKAPGSGARIPAQYGHPIDTPFNDIEIKPGKNWFELDVK